MPGNDRRLLKRSTPERIVATPWSPSLAHSPIGRCANLALGELRRLARLVEPGLLPLHDACVSGQEAGALERHAQLGIRLDERACNSVAHRAGLAAGPAAV